MTEAGKPARKRRWRDYCTAAGRRPVTEFIAGLPDADAAAVIAAMRDVQENGTQVARHLRGDIYEVRADADRVIYRILFATEGRSSQVLLALEGFKKKTQKTSRPERQAAVASFPREMGMLAIPFLLSLR